MVGYTERSILAFSVVFSSPFVLPPDPSKKGRSPLNPPKRKKKKKQNQKEQTKQTKTNKEGLWPTEGPPHLTLKPSKIKNTIQKNELFSYQSQILVYWSKTFHNLVQKTCTQKNYKSSVYPNQFLTNNCRSRHGHFFGNSSYAKI